MADTMRTYMNNIRAYPLIDRKEENRLAARIREGDPASREKLIQSNLRLVVKISHDFKGLGLPLQDLIAEGNIGLMRASEKFDPRKGAKFSSYAAWWIKQAMRRALSEKGKTIRVPVASACKISKIRSTRSALSEQLGRDPTDKEIAHEVDMSTRVVARLRWADLKTVSLQDPIILGEDSELRSLVPDASAIAPDEALGQRDMLQTMQRLLMKLDIRERQILTMRFGLDGLRPKTLEEVSKNIGRTRERVRQIQKRALDKLRTMIIKENSQHMLVPNRQMRG